MSTVRKKIKIRGSALVSAALLLCGRWRRCLTPGSDIGMGHGAWGTVFDRVSGRHGGTAPTYFSLLSAFRCLRPFSTRLRFSVRHPQRSRYACPTKHLLAGAASLSPRSLPARCLTPVVLGVLLLAAGQVYAAEVTVSGTVYTDRGITNIGSGKTVAISVNGAAADTTTAETDANGAYTLAGITINTGDVLTIYLEDETENAVTVTTGTGADMSGIDLYQNYLITRSDNGGALTNSDLDTANDNGDADITALYSGTTTITTVTGMTLFVPSGHSYSPGGPVNIGTSGTTSTLDIAGEMTMSGSDKLDVKGDFKTSGIFTGASGAIDIDRSFVMSGGTFTAPSGTMMIANTLDSDTTIFTYTSGTFHHNNGTLRFRSWVNMSSGSTRTHTINLSANSLTVSNLIYTGGERSETWRTLIYSHANANDLFIVEGDLLVEAATGSDSDARVRINAGKIDVRGDVTINSGLLGGSTALTLSGTADQVITRTGGTPPQGDWTINKSAGTVTLAADLPLSGTGQDMTLESGTFDLAGYDFSCAGTFTLQSGTVLRMQGSETVTAPTCSTGSRIEYSGSGEYTLSSYDPYDLYVDSAGGTFSLGADESVQNDLSISSDATVSVGSWQLAIGNDLTFSSAATSTLTGLGNSIIFDANDHDNTISGGTIDDAVYFASDTSATWTTLGGLTITGNTTLGKENYDGLVGWWKLDEVASTGAIIDSSGFGNHGTAQGSGGANNLPQPSTDVPLTLSGVSPRSFDFDGTDDYVDMQNNVSSHVLKPSFPITVLAWINKDVDNVTFPIFENNYRQNYYNGIGVYIHSTNVLFGRIGAGGPPMSSSRRSQSGTTLILAGEWHHVCVVFHSLDDIDLYVDGMDDGGTIDGTGSSLNYTADSSVIGITDLNNGDGNEFYTDGKIDDVRIYNRALSADEIAALAQGGSRGVIELGGNLEIQGDLTVSPNWTVSTNGYDLTASGNIIVDGSLLLDGSSLFLGDGKTANFRSGSSLEMNGTGSGQGQALSLRASSGGFANLTIDGNLTANYVSITNLTGSGFSIGKTATITGFDNITFDDFADRPEGAYITVWLDALTTSGALTSSGCAFDNTNGFATYNVTTRPAGEGAAAYWLFTEASGILFGELHDNDDGDPGSIRWDPVRYGGGSGDGYDELSGPGFVLTDATSLISAKDQIFFMHELTVSAASFVVTCGYQITAADDIRIKIPDDFNMLWANAHTEAVIDLSSAGAVSTTVSFANGDKTLVLNVTSDLTGGDVLTVSGLYFTALTAPSEADYLEMELGNDGVSDYPDFRTIRILTTSGTKYGGGRGDGYDEINGAPVTDDFPTPLLTGAVIVVTDARTVIGAETGTGAAKNAASGTWTYAAIDDRARRRRSDLTGRPV
jgi:hypothetical protein